MDRGGSIEEKIDVLKCYNNSFNSSEWSSVKELFYLDTTNGRGQPCVIECNKIFKRTILIPLHEQLESTNKKRKMNRECHKKSFIDGFTELISNTGKQFKPIDWKSENKGNILTEVDRHGLVNRLYDIYYGNKGKRNRERMLKDMPVMHNNPDSTSNTMTTSHQHPENNNIPDSTSDTTTTTSPTIPPASLPDSTSNTMTTSHQHPENNNIPDSTSDTTTTTSPTIPPASLPFNLPTDCAQSMPQIASLSALPSTLSIVPSHQSPDNNKLPDSTTLVKLLKNRGYVVLSSHVDKNYYSNWIQSYFYIRDVKDRKRPTQLEFDPIFNTSTTFGTDLVKSEGRYEVIESTKNNSSRLDTNGDKMLKRGNKWKDSFEDLKIVLNGDLFSLFPLIGFDRKTYRPEVMRWTLLARCEGCKRQHLHLDSANNHENNEYTVVWPIIHYNHSSEYIVLLLLLLFIITVRSGIIMFFLLFLIRLFFACCRWKSQS